MSNIEQYVIRVLEQAAQPKTHQQTVKIRLDRHADLQYLADKLGLSRTDLAGRLLEAAIQDARDSIDDFPGSLKLRKDT